MNFSELQSEVGLWLRDVPSDTLGAVPALINEAIRDAQREHNFSCMAFEIALPTVDGSHTLGAVNNFKSARQDPYWLDGTVQRAIGWASTAEQVRHRWPDAAAVGSPKLVLLSQVSDTAASFEVWPLSDGRCDSPNGQYPIVLPVWLYLPRLIAPSDSNWFTVNAVPYIRYLALAKATLLNLDEGRAGAYLKLAQDELAKLLRTEKRSYAVRPEQLSYSIGAAPGRRRFY